MSTDFELGAPSLKTWWSGPLLRMACTSPLFLMEMDFNILMFIWISTYQVVSDAAVQFGPVLG
jgi:hypothetical protein